MNAQIKKFLASGELFIWGSGAGLALAVLMVLGLLLLIIVNCLGYFWPADIVEVTLRDGTRLMGQMAGRETIPHSATPAMPEGTSRIRLKIGNRDIYGLDFKWVDESQIVSRVFPPDAVLLERREWGNLYGRVKAVYHGDQQIAGAAEAAWRELLPLVRDAARRPELATEYSVLMADANGREKLLPVGQILRALRPNDMSVYGKALVYASNVWAVLTTEPREANTEGGIFPAIFGTVMMVLIMTVAVVPFGVMAAVYLKEYARQGAIVRLVRIAVNNLAGVPSIVFGVFGLGFFVYAVGGTLDALFFADALPNPTFGTGGILWASLTLALLTVPVVIVATEEGLSAVPRDFREGSLALGATRFETLRQVILPSALPGILTGVILAMARAAGEVAPLMLTGVVKLAPALPVDAVWPFFHLDRKFMHLGFHIYDVGFQSPNVEAAKPMVYITTLVLIMVVVSLNLMAMMLRNRLRKKYAGSAV